MIRTRHKSYDAEPFTHGKLKGQYRTYYRSESKLRDFLENPYQDSRKLDYDRQLKDDQTTTVVVRNLIEKCPVVIKQYNTKNSWHAFRRTIRQSRAENCWISAEKLQNLGITIAPPVAFIQEYLGAGLKGRSWYLSEFVDSLSRLDHLPTINNETKRQCVMQKIVEMMAILRDHHISHGDMKATNLLLTREDRVVLLDLDAVKEHSTVKRACAGTNKDVVRFLKNWRDQPALLELAREKLEQAGFSLPN